jgi:hypothetical protein
VRVTYCCLVLVNKELEAIWKIRNYQLNSEKIRRRQHTDRMSLFPLRKTGMMLKPCGYVMIMLVTDRESSACLGIHIQSEVCEENGGTRFTKC